MIDNAVAHYEYLRHQEVPAEAAFEHARLRYGVPVDALRARVQGKVADHEAVMEALSDARTTLLRHAAQPESTEARSMTADTLRRLYEAVTGESVA